MPFTFFDFDSIIHASYSFMGKESDLNSSARSLLEEIGIPCGGKDWRDAAYNEIFQGCRARLARYGGPLCPATNLPCSRKDCEVRDFNRSVEGLHGRFDDGAYSRINRRRRK